MRVRIPRTSWQTVQAQHRALATMGKLAAEHSKRELPGADASPSKSAVRVVRGVASPSPTPPPALRSRPRRSSTADTREPPVADAPPETPPSSNRVRRREVLPGPSVKLVRDGVLEPLPTEISRPAPAVPRAVLPVIPSMRPAGFPAGLLRFDTLADSQPARKDDQHQGEAKPRKTAVTVAQVRSGIGRANAAAATRVPDVRKALDALLARWGPVKRTVVGGGRSVVAAVSRQPRAATGAAAGLLLLVAIASLASIGGGSSPTHHRTAGGPPPAVQQNTAPSPPAGGVSASPAVQAPVSLLEMTSSTSAVYQVTGPISVMLDASGPCWIQARRSGPNGGLLFQGTLVPGQSWTVAGPTWLRLGNPAAVSLTVNGEVVSPPAARGIPFDLQIG